MEDYLGLDKTDSGDADVDLNASGSTNRHRFLAGQDLPDISQSYLGWANDNIPNVWKIKNRIDLFELSVAWDKSVRELLHPQFEELPARHVSASNELWDGLSRCTDRWDLLETLRAHRRQGVLGK